MQVPEDVLSRFDASGEDLLYPFRFLNQVGLLGFRVLGP